MRRTVIAPYRSRHTSCFACLCASVEVWTKHNLGALPNHRRGERLRYYSGIMAVVVHSFPVGTDLVSFSDQHLSGVSGGE